MALVSKRLRDACLAPQLLRSLRVHVDGHSDDTLAAATAALQFLVAHASHVHHLDLTIHDIDCEGDGVLDEAEEREMHAAVAGCLAACATAGALRSLRVGGHTPLHGMAWLPALRQLRTLELGEEDAHLCLPAAASRLTALREARLTCRWLPLEGRLPPGLTRLYLQEGWDTAELPAQASARRTGRGGCCCWRACCTAGTPRLARPAGHTAPRARLPGAGGRAESAGQPAPGRLRVYCGAHEPGGAHQVSSGRARCGRGPLHGWCRGRCRCGPLHGRRRGRRRDARASNPILPPRSRRHARPLRCLQIGGGRALPAGLSALTQLECLGVGMQDGAAEPGEMEAWAGAVAAALPRLTRLTTLALSVGDPEFEWGLRAIARLPRLQRLWLWDENNAGPYSPATLDGPCLASLRWLALRWEWLEGAAAALRGAPRLEYVCSLSTPAPAPTYEEDEAGEAGEAQAAWDAAWDALATHAPLRCFSFESHNQRPSFELLDALLGLKTRRPALRVQRLALRADIKHYCSSESFAQMMDAPEVAPPPL